MIELLILYILQNRDRTMYSIRKEIINLLGAISQPSDGTIYPALDRLKKQNCINVTEKMSEGGKKSTYYSLQKDGHIKAKKLFLENSAECISVFCRQLSIKIAVMSFFDKETQEEFIENSIKDINLYKNSIQHAIDDEYRGLDKYQKDVYSSSWRHINGACPIMGRPRSVFPVIISGHTHSSHHYSHSKADSRLCWLTRTIPSRPTGSVLRHKAQKNRIRCPGLPLP